MKQRTILPYSSIMIDINMKQVMKMVTSMLKKQNRGQLEEKIGDAFLRDRKEEEVLATLCVRSSFSMLLDSYKWSAGSEVLMTAVNIPSMAQIVRYHSLVPIPINLSFDQLAPSDYHSLDSLISPKTKAIVISYIYGCQFDATALIQWANNKGLIIIEDLAESFRGNKLTGHPLAHFSLFSFGTIKTCTAFGGSLLVIRKSPHKYQQLKTIRDSYPILPNSFFAKRSIKNVAGIFALNTHFGNRNIRKTCNYFGIDYKETMIGMVRGFPGTDDFLGQFQQQMPVSMLYLLAHRICTYQSSETMLSNIKQFNAQDYLIQNGVKIPGHLVKDRTFWLFPILVPENQVQFCYEQLNLRGVDAYKGATQLQVIPPPQGSNYSTEQTKQFFSNFLYLPIHKGVPANVIKLICEQVIEVTQFAQQINNSKKSQTKQGKEEIELRASL